MSETKAIQVKLAFEAKTYDIDYAGIVNNQVYIRWLEDLRLALMQANFSLADLLVENLSPVLEKTEITYRRPLRLFDRAEGRMWLSKMGKARWELKAEFVMGDLIVASAYQTGYFVDLERLRPVRIPQALREKWQAVQDGER